MAAALALHGFAGAASEHLLVSLERLVLTSRVGESEALAERSLERVAEDPARTLARDCFATLAMTVSTLAMTVSTLAMTILSRG